MKSDRYLNRFLREGVVFNTITLGRVRIKSIQDDEVHCQVVNGRAQIVLSRTAATRRILNQTSEK